MEMPTRQYVASGSFETGTTRDCRLKAYLGTCVGVAAFDAVAGVGGLMHLLLPEPVSGASVTQPEKYATTGMPIFIRQLMELGATLENMRAVVAGGALVGPVTPQDIQLDIGGRTAERATAALDAAGITVVQSETGGFFTCCLTLDMQTWQYEIHPAGFDVPVAKPGSQPTLDRVLGTIATIRPIPQVVLKVLRIIETGDYDIDKVAEEVKKDQVISARTIQLCNSALFAKRQEVATLDHALVFLGREPFLKLVISAAVQSYYNQSGNGYSLCKGGLYHHAFGTAMIAEAIAAETGAVVPAIAYTAGLLHDIGKVVIDQFMTDAYPMLYRELQDPHADIIAAEKRIIGLDHTRAGALLATNWSLPAPLANVILHHHHPETSPGQNLLVTVVHLADLLMSRFHSGLELERIGTRHLADHLARLALSGKQFNKLVDLVPQQVFEPASEAMQPAAKPITANMPTPWTHSSKPN